MSSITTTAYVSTEAFRLTPRNTPQCLPAKRYGTTTLNTAAQKRKAEPFVNAQFQAVKIFDSRDHSTANEWLMPDFSVGRPNGTGRKTSSPQGAFENAKQIYDKLFTSYQHVPTSTIIVDIDTGYKVRTHARKYANLLAVAAINPSKISSPDGSKWDLTIRVFSEVDIVKDAKSKHHGMLVKHMQFVLDQNEVLKSVQARGISVPSFFKRDSAG